MPVLVDTDWIIHSLRGRADIIEKMRSCAAEGIAVSVVSLAELYEGVSPIQTTPSVQKLDQEIS
jgi:predicted nucleic acid-binding protein